jgi:hypothetical protein
LDGTCQQEDNFDNLFVFRNPIIEWLLFFLRDIFLEPELHFFSGLEYMRGCSVNGVLYVIEGRFQHRVVSVKSNIDLKEWLEHLLGRIATAADPLLHLVERVLSSME